MVIGAVLSLILAGCGGGSGHHAASGNPPGSSPASENSGPEELGNDPSTIAVARDATVKIFRSAGGASPSMQLHNPNPDGAPRVFLVVDREPGWLHVLLPVAPNGSEGWISADEVGTVETAYWIAVPRAAA